MVARVSRQVTGFLTDEVSSINICGTDLNTAD
jgi:hypothetical protein